MNWQSFDFITIYLRGIIAVGSENDFSFMFCTY